MKFLNLTYLFLIFVLLQSCGNGGYSQNYNDFEEFSNITNKRATGWFPVQLIRSDASEIKNVSYLSTKCIFGVFNYENDENYSKIFKEENFINEHYYKLFQSQIDLVKDVNPCWFPDSDFWKTIKNGIILIDNCYAYKDSDKKKIYFFHPIEESTFINGEIYPGIRHTIR